MTDDKTSDRDVNRAIRSWLHEDRHEDVSRVAGAVLDQVDTIPQRRAMWWPARRTPTMNKVLAIGLGAAALVVAVLIGYQVFGSTGSIGVGAGPTATPESTASPEPSPSSPTSIAPLTQSFTSTLYGYSVSYPEGWTAQAATERWTDGPSTLPFDDPQADRLYDPDLRDHLFLTIASRSIGDSTPEDWIVEQIAEWEDLEQCRATEPIAVGEASGLIGSEGCDLAVVTTDGRGYWISLRKSNDDPAAVAPYDRAWFEEVLATVQLHPKDAVDGGPSPSP